MSALLTALKASADETRLRIIGLLADGEMPVGDIVDCLQQSQPRVSRHLKLLVEAGLLVRMPEGTQVFYRLTQDSLYSWLIDGIIAGGARLEDDRARRLAILERRRGEADAYFQRLAPIWDEERKHYISEARVEAALLALAAPKAEDVFLDIGTGTGRILQHLGAGVAHGIGLDQSRAMLGLARAALSQAGLPHCTVQQGDMHVLPYETRRFSLISLHQVLHFAEQPEKVVAEAARVLLPGGRLIIADFLPHAREELRRDHAHRRLGFSEQEIARYASEAGLRITVVETLEGPEITVAIWRLERQ